LEALSVGASDKRLRPDDNVEEAGPTILPLETTASAAVGLTLIAAGHTRGWPILRGGAQSLTDALVRHLEDLGGRVETGREVTELPLSDLVLADITPRQLLRIAGSHLSTVSDT
jgi:phytoene dehydrogenase-like protein